jgi:hypothetical protein
VPETPLLVVGTDPEAFSVVRPFGGSVKIDFQRRLSERPARGTLREGVVVSPRTGAVEVQHRRRGLEISMEGGFRETTIYRVTLLPVFRDLFQNPLEGPYDLFFSTGPEFEPNVLAGLVMDRIRGEEVDGARVDARPVENGPTHSTVTDSTGIFTFPYLPAGRYRVTAYEDRNRNREPDFEEPQDSMTVELERGDTLIVTDLTLLQPDTTAAVLEDVAVVDSLALRLTFDDHLDPDDPLEEVRARLVRDGLDVPEVVEILHLHEWEARQEELEAEEVEEAPLFAEEPEPPLPSREIVLLLSEPLLPEVTYRVVVEDVTNINGVPGGGGEVEVEGPAEPEEDPPPEDEEAPPEGTRGQAG